MKWLDLHKQRENLGSYNIREGQKCLIRPASKDILFHWQAYIEWVIDGENKHSRHIPKIAERGNEYKKQERAQENTDTYIFRQQKRG